MRRDMPDPENLATVSSLIAGFGIAILLFRIQREVQMQAQGKPIWIPWADWLLVIATVLCLGAVLFPIVSGLLQPITRIRVAASAASASIILVIGYVFSILAHYRLILSFGRTGLRENPEPSEAFLVITCIVAAVGAAAWVFRSLKEPAA